MQYSRQVMHRPHRWHIQEAGKGPLLLLIHGAGGATHSFRSLFPLLAQTSRVVAVDLPGQGFTHKIGDIVTIATPGLGALVNRVTTSDRAPRWSFGTAALMRNLAARGMV